MITVKSNVLRRQKNFWNGCVFHPTDAVEDPWGKRILDRMSQDKAMKMIRIYTMFEDIVYLDESGNLQYDFRVNDLRLDYLVEKGFDIMLAYATVPDCISIPGTKTSNSKNKTRYKGKLFNTMPPKDYALWQEVCYQYTKHIVERYGIETVSKWYLHCFNEPDIPGFFLADEEPQNYQARLDAYCPLYYHFEKGLRRVSEKLHIGGPALAWRLPFLGGFLDYVKEREDKIWVGTFREVAAYVAERDAVRLEQTVKGNRISVTPSLDLDPELYNMPLTMKVEGVSGVKAKQGGKRLTVVYRDGSAIFDFDPYGGTIRLQVVR